MPRTSSTPTRSRASPLYTRTSTATSMSASSSRMIRQPTCTTGTGAICISRPMKLNLSTKGIRNGCSGMGGRGGGGGGRRRRRRNRSRQHSGCASLYEDSTDVGAITSRILVAGIGNIFLGDDGFGSEVIRSVPRRLAGPRVQLVDYGIKGMHLAYDLLDGCEALVLVDAIPSRGAPGTIHVFEADHESLT